MRKERVLAVIMSVLMALSHASHNRICGRDDRSERQTEDSGNRSRRKDSERRF